MNKLVVFLCSVGLIWSAASIIEATPITWDENGKINSRIEVDYADIDFDYYTDNMQKDVGLISFDIYNAYPDGINFNNSFISQTDLFSWICRIWPFICSGWEWPPDWPNHPPPNNGGGGSPKQVPPVPEPATMLLLGTGLICLAGLGKKKLMKHQ